MEKAGGRLAAFQTFICMLGSEDPLPGPTCAPVYLLGSVSECTPASLWAQDGRLIAEIPESSLSTPPLKGNPRVFLTASGS